MAADRSLLDARCADCGSQWDVAGPTMRVCLGGCSFERDGPSDPWRCISAPRERQGLGEPESLAREEEPAAPPLDLAALLGELRSFVRNYVVLGDHEADAVALWIAHTWASAAAETTPYLGVGSAEKRSGKTRLLEVVNLVVARPWLTGKVSAAVLVRKIAKDQPTLLLDESDAAFKGEKEYAETLRSVLNAGHRRGGVASLCVKRGGDFELRDFPVFGPKAIAGIGKLPDTIADRAIPVVLKRRAPSESVQRFRQREAEASAAPLRTQCAAWVAASLHKLQDARPAIPDQLDDRAADGWEPLLAIAEAAGGDWPEKARNAALALSSGDGREDDSLGVRLLCDIKSIFRTERSSSAWLVEALLEVEESPWGDLRGKPLDTRKLASLLKPYGIRPHQVRLDAETTLKGYGRADFADAWDRYAHIPPGRETSETRETFETPRHEQNGTDVSDVSLVSRSQGVRADEHERVGDGHLTPVQAEALLLWRGAHFEELEDPPFPTPT